MQERSLLVTALNTIVVNAVVHAASDGGGFVGPSIDEFFPEAFLFQGTPFEINRIILVRLIALVALLLFFGLGTRRMRLVPGRFQSVVEMALDFARVNIAEDLLGKKDGRRFLPLLSTIFFLVLFFNITGIIPLLNVAGTSTIGLPILLALIAYVAFIYAGVRKSPAGFFRNALFPPGVPWPLYILITPIEFLSTFVLRPVTLTFRLTFNMIAGHLLLVLFFTGTTFFFLEAPALFKLFGVGTLAFGLVFIVFEALVAVLQAYIFALLTAVYIQLALADEH